MPTNTTNPLPSISEPVVDRYRRWNPIWYRWIKPLLETVKNNSDELGTTQQNITTLTTTVAGNTTSISQVQSSVDGISAQWGVTINTNGRVTGMVRLDSGASGSTFSVLADRFIVAHPTNNAQTIQAFVVGLVNGVSTVGINGNLVVDGTILARHIDVDSLSAITADVGTVTAGVLRSADNNFVIDLNNKTITITT